MTLFADTLNGSVAHKRIPSQWCKVEKRTCTYRKTNGELCKRSVGNGEDVFRSKRGGPLLETTILNQGLHPALRALGVERAGMHAFRRGCNRRWELAAINPAVIRQQMGHSSATMTRLYTGQIPPEDVASAFSIRLEKMENEVAA
jgi:integrase